MAPEVRILPSAHAALDLVLGELRALLLAPTPQLLSFATGNTYTAMLQKLDAEVQAGRLRLDRLFATHLDEYLGFGVDQPGGMVHELITACPSLRQLLQQERFLPVPNDGADASLQAHKTRLQQLGGIALQLLGIGRNGHLAFNEPGTPFELGFHRTTLAATTREDARTRFAPAEVPHQAVTSGIADVMSARRLLLCAFGAGKAPAVKAMLRGEVGPHCPASAIRRHGNVLVLLDREAASLLDAANGAASS